MALSFLGITTDRRTKTLQRGQGAYAAGQSLRGLKGHQRKVGIQPTRGPCAGGGQKAGGITGQFARIKRNPPPIGQTATHGIQHHAVAGDLVLDRAAQAGEGQGGRFSPRKISPRLGLVQQRLGQSG
jgi:hypothetical protein